ncbi:MAG: phosphodiester glycosidase family protein [Patescibacteria group bacterium]
MLRTLPRLFAASLLLLATGLPLATNAATSYTNQLIKLSCPAHADVNDPCKAVYYVGGDDKRHAFPNDKTYFTWFVDFAGVKTVSSSALASIPLGPNVSYRPGVRMVKFTTLDKVYAVGLGGELRWIATEAVAQGLYGTNWNTQIDDISDAFFSDYYLGADIVSATDFHKDSERLAATSPDANLPITSKTISVVTEHGTFTADVITLQKNKFTMVTDTANTSDCQNGCAAQALGTFAAENNAVAGIHGTYFCPPEYADCASKTNTFLSPVYNSAAGTMINSSSLVVHEGPILATATDGRSFFSHRTKDFGSSVASLETTNNATLAAAISNYPSLVENGQVIVDGEARLAETNPTVKSLRGGIGMNGSFFYLVIAHQATVSDLAWVIKALGATDALNLDGGGSSALWYNGTYVVGPGRPLPNAILFKTKTP